MNICATDYSNQSRKTEVLQGLLAECPCFVLMNVPWVMVYLFEMSVKKWYVRDGKKKIILSFYMFYLNCNCQEWFPALKCLYCVVATQDKWMCFFSKAKCTLIRNVLLNCFDDTWDVLWLEMSY